MQPVTNIFHPTAVCPYQHTTVTDASKMQHQQQPQAESMPLHSQVVFLRTYARISNGVRETWQETVQRYMNFIRPRCSGVLSDEAFGELHAAILAMDVMPSMRALATAGPAAARDNMVMYNCAYTAVDCLEALPEIMEILMGGTGVGFSVEDHVVARLPPVARLLPGAEAERAAQAAVVVDDSREGWATAWRHLLHSQWIDGRLLGVDVGKVRRAGEPMHTMQGIASGPEALLELIRYAEELLKRAQGRRLRPEEVHALVCHIAQVTVRGGKRRSALISLGNLDNTDLRYMKTRDSCLRDPALYASNNSAVIIDANIADATGLLEAELQALAASRIGERGLFNREAAQQAAKAAGRRRHHFEFGTNPCGEIVLRSCQLCNLTEVVVRPDDTLASLSKKVAIATLLGTIQSTYVHFPGVRQVWADNCREERLLGVSLTGIYDNAMMSTPGQPLADALDSLRKEAIATNARYAALFGIPPSAAITCVKPSGTVSLVVDSSAGIHPRQYRHYVRNVRISTMDPLFDGLRKLGVPWAPEPPGTAVLRFPVCAPPGARVAADVSAEQQMELAVLYTKHWAEHNVSCTVYVPPGGWPGVIAKIVGNIDAVRGMSFLDLDGGDYSMPPFEQISAAEYARLDAEVPAALKQPGALARLLAAGLDRAAGEEQLLADRDGLEYACTAGGCEIRGPKK
jgi:ribonucleoside-triphosphate reductase (thioredoxin)